MKNFYYVIVLLFLVTLSSCKDKIVEQNLLRAESLIPDLPDSALVILDSLYAQTPLSNSEQNARLALLLTQARDKNYYFETNDSIISVACDYYVDSRYYRYACLSCFYKGLILYNKKDYVESIRILLKSLLISDKFHDDFIKAKINEAIADVYYSVYNNKEAIRYRTLASKYYNLAGKKEYALFSDVDIAREYAGIHQFERSIELLDSISSEFDFEDDALKGFLTDSYIFPLSELGRNKEALQKFREAESFIKSRMLKTRDCSIVADVLLKNNMPDSALMYIDIARKNDIDGEDAIQYHFFLKDYAKYSGNTVEYMSEIDSIYILRNRIVGNVYDNDIALAERDFYNEQSMVYAVRSERYKVLMWSSCVLAVFLAVCFVLYHKFRLRQNRQKVENKILEIQLLSYEMSKKDESLEQMDGKLKESQGQVIDMKQQVSDEVYRRKECQKLVEKLFHRNFEMLDNICNEYYENKDTDKGLKRFVSSFETEINKINSTDFLFELEKIVNACWYNAISEIKENVDGISQDDIKFICLYMSGFSTRTICLLLDIKPGNFYNKIKRLRDKVTIADIKNKNKILEKLRK